MDCYDREIQLSGFGKAVEVVVMAPDNLSKGQRREFNVDQMLDLVVKIINDRDCLSDAIVVPLDETICCVSTYLYILYIFLTCLSHKNVLGLR